MTDTVARYTGQRAEVLANLVLTRRKDVRILTLKDQDDAGIDLIAQLLTPAPNLPASPYFGVRVKGTSNPLDDERAANRFANQVVRSMTSQSFIMAPVALMVFSMEGDRGYWGWLMKPSVDERNGPSLAKTERMDMAEVNASSLDTLFEDVTAWFEAMGGVLVAH